MAKTLEDIENARFEADIRYVDPVVREARREADKERKRRKRIRAVSQLRKEAGKERAVHSLLLSQATIINPELFLSDHTRTIRHYALKQLVRKGFLPSRDVDAVLDDVVQLFALKLAQRPNRTVGKLIASAVAKLLEDWRTEARRRRILCGANRNDSRTAKLYNNGKTVQLESVAFRSLADARGYSDQRSYEAGQDNVALLYGLETRSILLKLSQGWTVRALAHEMGMDKSTLQRRTELERETVREANGL